jgi:small nuclear ribonucleoprotein (snRNP)-like protein
MGPFRRLVRETVLVHTRDDRSIRGVLLGAYRSELVLAHAVYLVEGGSEQQLEGEVHIPVSNVSFLQRLGGGA